MPEWYSNGIGEDWSGKQNAKRVTRECFRVLETMRDTERQRGNAEGVGYKYER